MLIRLKEDGKESTCCGKHWILLSSYLVRERSPAWRLEPQFLSYLPLEFKWFMWESHLKHCILAFPFRQTFLEIVVTYQAHQDKVTKIKALDSCKIESIDLRISPTSGMLAITFLRQPSSFCRDDSAIIGE